MNPLFKEFSRSAKAAGRSVFALSKLGRLIAEMERKRSRRGQAEKYMRDIGRKIHANLPPASRVAAGRMARYAREQEQTLVDQALTAMGPIGELVKAFLRPRGKAPTPRVDKELEAAQGLLTAFGFEVIAPPPKRGGILPKVAQTKKYLETLGFRVAAPESGRLKGLPGWQEFLRKTGEPAMERAGRPHERTTVDLNIGGRTRRVRKDDPLVTGVMILVTSSNVHSIGFDINPHSAQLGTLKVRFLQARGESRVAGPLYEYYNVPTRVFELFRKAASKGRFVWDRLRIRGTVSGHQFDYKLAGISWGHVPRKATLMPAGEAFVKRVFLGENVRTGEGRLFESRPTMLVRPMNRGTEPNRGQGFRR